MKDICWSHEWEYHNPKTESTQKCKVCGMVRNWNKDLTQWEIDWSTDPRN